MMRMNPDLKVYLTEIKLDGKNPELRTGMSCQAEIVIEQIDNAMYVPVQSVVYSRGEHVAYVQNGSGFARTPVEIGLDNDRVVHVKSGLSASQKVMLAPPIEASSAPTGTSEISAAQDAEFKRAIEEARQNVRSNTRLGPNGGLGASDGPGGSGIEGDRRSRGRDRRGGGMTDEQRAEMRRRFENMSPEERRQAMERMRQMRGDRGGEGGGRGNGGDSGNGRPE
jgi:hypothetical protein